MSRQSSFQMLPPLGLALLALSGCAQHRGGYAMGSADQYYVSSKLQTVTGGQIERGERRPVLDGVGWVLGIPSKIVLWDWRMDNHRISPETEAAVAEYLSLNELSTVKVRLNQYAPRDEWRRLTANDAVGPGWRYTLGTIYWLGDTIFPGRVWGGDRYNPFTNTVQIYSDSSAIALHEAGHSKDWARRKYKGSYGALYILPGAPLWHEAVATRDALSYVAELGTPDEQEEAYRLLYPAYGTYVGNALGDLTPIPGNLPYVGCVVVGHVVGRVQGRRAANARRAAETTPIASEPNQELEFLPPVEPDLSGP